MRTLYLFVTLPLILLLAACNASPPPPSLPALPTSAAIVALPTELPASPTSPLPPTSQPAPTEETIPATATFPPTPTPRPTATPKPVDPLVNIINPAPNSQVEVGAPVKLSGLTQLNQTDSVWISLFSNDGRLIFAQEAEIERRTIGSSNWEANVDLPPSMTGIAMLEASVQSEDGEILAQAAQTNNFYVNTEAANRYILLDEPIERQNVVAGHYVVLRGYSQNPSLNRITVEIFAEDCQTSISKESFVVSGTGAWFGLPNVPENITGEACVAAYTGARGEENWREVQTRINILPKDDPASTGVLIINPPVDAAFKPGETMSAWGVIYNAVDREAVVSLILEDGQLLTREEITVDRLGYWEADILLPTDVAGIASFDVTTGEAGDFGHAQTQRLIALTFE